ncbi:hypothetical protein PINS_up019162 [Pythium insidiosum]|nr:hypothetical protein PINS_up019162 [Pythium insidiosum]
MEPAPPFDAAEDSEFVWGTAPSSATAVSDAPALPSNPFDAFDDLTTSVPPLPLALPTAETAAPSSSISVGSPLISFSPVAATSVPSLSLHPQPTAAVVADLLSFSPVAAPAPVPSDSFFLPSISVADAPHNDTAGASTTSAIGELLSFSPVAAQPSGSFTDGETVFDGTSPSSSAAIVTLDQETTPSGSVR